MEGRNIAHERNLAFQGFAKVGLDALQFKHDSHRGLDNRNVTRLRKIFELEGCQRFDELHFVDVVVPKSSLERHQNSTAGPVLSPQPASHWLNAPVLDLGQLECLSGLHRIQAALQYLQPNDRWWLARVYSDGKKRQIRGDYI